MNKVDIPFELPTAQDILEAAKRIENYIHRTPIFTSQTLNKKLETEFFFKCENFQKAGVFKSRGATNAILQIPEDKLKNGVATHSSGNHAQALTRVAKMLGIKAYLVMPENSNKEKIQSVLDYGGEITFCKPTLADREKTLQIVISRTNANVIHPYDDLRVITGQATAALEFIEQVKNLDYILVPIGGGGLTSGTALAVHYFAPNIKVIATEPLYANDAWQSFQSKSLIPSIRPNTIADGLLTSLGQYTFPIVLNFVHNILTVREETIIEAMRLLIARLKILIEPSSAVPMAAVMENLEQFKNKRVGIILSGGNIDINRFSFR